MTPHHAALALFLAPFLALAGCVGGTAVQDGPSAPSGTITPFAGTPMTTADVSIGCVGPADQLATLASLCTGGHAHAIRGRARAGSDMLYIADETAGPSLLLYAFPPPGTPSDAMTWPLSGIGYAAAIVTSMAPGVSAESQWSTSEPVTGALTSTTFSHDEDCIADAWRGGGELHWRDVTLTVAWSTDHCR